MNLNTHALSAAIVAALTLATCEPVDARFLSRDPVPANSSNGANFNGYWYANNNPYRFTDPDGRVAVITYKQDGSIDVQVHVNYSGPAASAANASTIASDTSSAWSGSYLVGGNTTTVNVSVVPVGANTPAGAANNISLLNGPTSDTASQGASFVRGGNSGEWNMSSPSMANGAAPHEVGHLMGARDRYSAGVDANGNRTTSPNAGYAGNLMAELSGRPDSRTISEILGNSSNIVVREPPPPPPLLGPP